MQKYKIFISSVLKELKEERRAVKQFILKDPLLSEYFDVFLFEDSPAKSKSVEKAYLEEVGKCDIYLGIFGSEYGSLDNHLIHTIKKVTDKYPCGAISLR
ncbi:DUF4062 domain-containing protein [Candidatus Desantisbacteria bacterium]|nr:DUF4062 domain-containing protein [Candidatus Desantisbacteria bacterium]